MKALRNRRSMTKSRPDPVPIELVEQVIESASWAPNHRRTNPWRFAVVTGDARVRMGEVMAQALEARMEGGIESDRKRELLEKERAKPLRAPIVIAVGAKPSPDPRTIEIEEVEAVAAGVENMMLAAEALGLGTMWRTGDAAYDPLVKRFLDFDSGTHIVAFVYLGYPEIVPPLARSPLSPDFINWIDS